MDPNGHYVRRQVDVSLTHTEGIHISEFLATLWNSDSCKTCA